MKLSCSSIGLLVLACLMSTCRKETISINHPPVANAGNDISLVLPTDSTTLDGSASTDPENNISSYTWRKISGPASYQIIEPNSAKTKLNKLTGGVYLFELKVIDKESLTTKDTVKVIVSSVVATTSADEPGATTFENLLWTHAGPGAIADEEIWIGIEERPDLFNGQLKISEVKLKFDTSSSWLDIPKWDGTLTPPVNGYAYVIMYANSFYVESYPMNFQLIGRTASLKIKFQ